MESSKDDISAPLASWEDRHGLRHRSLADGLAAIRHMHVNMTAKDGSSKGDQNTPDQVSPWLRCNCGDRRRPNVAVRPLQRLGQDHHEPVAGMSVTLGSFVGVALSDLDVASAR